MSTGALRVVAIVSVLIGLAARALGVSLLSQATSGVGGIGAACFFGIVARLAQASAHQDEMEQWTKRGR